MNPTHRPSSCHLSQLTAGGAFQAASRLVTALSSHSTSYLITPKRSENPQRSRLEATASQQIERVNYRLVRRPGTSTTFTLLSPTPTAWEANIAGDVANLHWVVSDHLLRQVIGRDRPVLWTLHDCWPFTGGCHHPQTCRGFSTACSQCPQARKPFQKLVSAAKLRRSGVIRDTGVHAVAPSKWMTQKAMESGAFRSVTHIPNPLPQLLFEIGNRPEEHYRLQNPSAERPLSIAAIAHDWRDPNKGLSDILRMTERINNDVPIRLRLIGGPFMPGERVGHLATAVGRVTGVRSLCDRLSGVDALVSGSIEENLPTVLMEAQALGIPCIARNSGGVSDVILNGATGWLVDTLDMVDASHFLLARGSAALDASRLSQSRAREIFGPTSVAKQYLRLYRQILDAEV